MANPRRACRHAAARSTIRLSRSAIQRRHQTTIEAIGDAGLITDARQVLKIMLDADPPPGTSHKGWIDQHEQALEERGRKHVD